MKNESIQTPVLFIVFNRPDTTKIVFEAIKKAKPKKLYIAADGPRIGKPTDFELCKETKEIVNQVDWECELNTKFSETNLGCKLAVSSAITWAFSYEEQLIILEDDCQPATTFFVNAQTLLQKYKNDPEIMMISGDNYNEEYHLGENDYTFSSIAHHIWGWATWRRAWNKYDIDMTYFNDLMTSKEFVNILVNKKTTLLFKKKLRNFYYSEQRNNTWDYQWFFSIIYNKGLTIVLKKNQISNIGLEGAHTNETHEYHNRSVDEDFIIINHPIKIEADIGYDKHHFKNHWKKMLNVPYYKKILIKIKRLLVKL